jgi:hypothetical protein
VASSESLAGCGDSGGATLVMDGGCGDTGTTRVMAGNAAGSTPMMPDVGGATAGRGGGATFEERKRSLRLGVEVGVGIAAERRGLGLAAMLMRSAPLTWYVPAFRLAWRAGEWAGKVDGTSMDGANEAGLATGAGECTGVDRLGIETGERAPLLLLGVEVVRAFCGMPRTGDTTASAGALTRRTVARTTGAAGNSGCPAVSRLPPTAAKRYEPKMA